MGSVRTRAIAEGRKHVQAREVAGPSILHGLEARAVFTISPPSYLIRRGAGVIDAWPLETSRRTRLHQS